MKNKIFLSGLLAIVLLASLGFVNVQPIKAGTTICGSFVTDYSNTKLTGYMYTVLITDSNERILWSAKGGGGFGGLGNGYWRIFDPNIVSTNYDLQGGLVSKEITGYSNAEQINSLQDCNAPPQSLIPIFVYPQDGQAVGYGGDFLFKVEQMEGAGGYLWGFFQNGAEVWENLRDEGTLSGNEYGIPVGGQAHSKFAPGDLEVSVRANIDGQWSDQTVITIHLLGDVISVPISSTQPPPQIPSNTFIPPSRTPVPPTWTLIPSTQRIISTLIIPAPATWTSIPPTQRIISTIVIPPPITATNVQNQLVGLQVRPINQLLPNGSKMSNGKIDYGRFNCAIASTAMVFQYLKSQGVLDGNDTTDYLAVRDILRSQGENADPGNDLDMQAINDFTPPLTHNKLKTNVYWLAPGHFEETINNELNANRPVIAVVPDWSILPGHSGWASAAHAILIHGLQNGKLFYIDPWGGESHEISLEYYIKSALIDGKSLAIMTFVPTSISTK